MHNDTLGVARSVETSLGALRRHAHPGGAWAVSSDVLKVGPVGRLCIRHGERYDLKSNTICLSRADDAPSTVMTAYWRSFCRTLAELEWALQCSTAVPMVESLSFCMRC